MIIFYRVGIKLRRQKCECLQNEMCVNVSIFEPEIIKRDTPTIKDSNDGALGHYFLCTSGDTYILICHQSSH